MTRSYDYSQRPGETIEAYYRRIAKVADQRLLRLERLADKEGYGNADKWAYKRAMMDIDRWSPDSKKKRFNTKPPADKRSLQAKINDIKQFLGSESSTKQGLRNIYEKRLKSLNENNSTNFNLDDLMDLFDSALWKKMDNKDYSSDQIVKAIGYIKDTATDDKTFQALKDRAVMRGKVPEFTKDPFQNKLINEMLLQEDAVNAMYKYLKNF